MSKNNFIKNVIFLGKKPGASRALQYLLDKGVNVKMIIARKIDGDAIYALAKKHRIPIFEDDKVLYEKIKRQDKNLSDIDLVISYLFWRKIRPPLISLGKKGCINFHPAPLPEYKGLAGYNTAILDQKKSYGVSAHFIDSEDFDTGPIINVKKFSIDDKLETVISLEKKSQANLLLLFKEVINYFLQGKKITTKPNLGGIYLNKEQFEKLKEVDIDKDSSETIDRKIRAFFFPPYTGAYVKIKGREFTLLNQAILNLIYEEKNISHHR